VLGTDRHVPEIHFVPRAGSPPHGSHSLLRSPRTPDITSSTWRLDSPAKQHPERGRPLLTPSPRLSGGSLPTLSKLGSRNYPALPDWLLSWEWGEAIPDLLSSSEVMGFLPWTPPATRNRLRECPASYIFCAGFHCWIHLALRVYQRPMARRYPMLPLSYAATGGSPGEEISRRSVSSTRSL